MSSIRWKSQTRNSRKMKAIKSKRNSIKKVKNTNAYADQPSQQYPDSTVMISDNKMAELQNPVENGGRGSKEILANALYDFNAKFENELSFQKGEKLLLLKRDGEWWFAESTTNGSQGLIPSNYVQEMISVENEDWFFKVSRSEAEKLLLSSDNEKGAFLVRQSETRTGNYSLSVRNWSRQKGNHVSHYMIHREENLDKYYISPCVSFDTLQELVSFYNIPQEGVQDLMLAIHYVKSVQAEFGKGIFKLTIPCCQTGHQMSVSDYALKTPQAYIQADSRNENKTGDQCATKKDDIDNQSKEQVNMPGTPPSRRTTENQQLAYAVINDEYVKTPDGQTQMLGQEQNLSHILEKVENHLSSIAITMPRICNILQQISTTMTILLDQTLKQEGPTKTDASVQVDHTELSHKGKRYTTAVSKSLADQYAVVNKFFK
ncbi:tyrosine-protein kinase HCK-like isoform X2 [Protopterus annectens]|uniref:tyrosine-protein kinase HCK-like isoform X2 n=1 Tax=Protopterus annectens TaxID=7888 RepID=UPI001CFB4C32|nr:tyrosine-protein kinase HCK-like isoform X2 [Protopterus annectens]